MVEKDLGYLFVTLSSFHFFNKTDFEPYLLKCNHAVYMNRNAITSKQGPSFCCELVGLSLRNVSTLSSGVDGPQETFWASTSTIIELCRSPVLRRDVGDSSTRWRVASARFANCDTKLSTLVSLGQLRTSVNSFVKLNESDLSVTDNDLSLSNDFADADLGKSKYV